MNGIGIDIGSTYTKYCVLREGRPPAFFSEPTPVRQREYFDGRLRNIRREYGSFPIVSCGYGRKNCGGDRAVSELNALAAGVARAAPGTETVLDIGGQDTKLICQRDGRLSRFFVNDKCAAGCGIFLGNTLRRLNLSFRQIDLSDGRLPALRLSSSCAVFAQSEIVELTAAGADEDEILRAVIVHILSQAKTLLEKVDCQEVGLSGGLTRIPGFAAYAGAVLEKPARLLPRGPYLAAVGCALLAEKEKGKREK